MFKVERVIQARKALTMLGVETPPIPEVKDLGTAFQVWGFRV